MMKPKKFESKRGQFHQIASYSYTGAMIKKIAYEDMYHGTKWTAAFSYDSSQRLLAVRFPDGEYAFKYDTIGRVVEELRTSQKMGSKGLFTQAAAQEEETELITFEYNDQNQIVRRVDTQTGYGTTRKWEFRYTYDSSGRVLTRENVTGGRNETYKYGSAEHPLRNVQLPACFLTDYEPAVSLVLAKETAGTVEYSNTVVQSDGNFPTEIKEVDYNNFVMNIKIKY